MGGTIPPALVLGELLPLGVQLPDSALAALASERKARAVCLAGCVGPPCPEARCHWTSVLGGAEGGQSLASGLPRGLPTTWLALWGHRGLGSGALPSVLAENQHAVCLRQS